MTQMRFLWIQGHWRFGVISKSYIIFSQAFSARFSYGWNIYVDTDLVRSWRKMHFQTFKAKVNDFETLQPWHEKSDIDFQPSWNESMINFEAELSKSGIILETWGKLEISEFLKFVAGSWNKIFLHFEGNKKVDLSTPHSNYCTSGCFTRHMYNVGSATPILTNVQMLTISSRGIGD